MFTYLVVDPSSKNFYIGSTHSLQTGRPWKHLKGKSGNPRLANITAKRNCFVFVSEDDGLDTRDEEQYYLDFYFGTEKCLNNSQRANGGDRYQEMVEWNVGRKDSFERTFQRMQTRMGVDIEQLWEEVRVALSSGKHFWGRKQISEKYKVSLPTVRHIANAIRNGVSLRDYYGSNT